MEYVFIALDKGAEEAKWLRNFLEDIPMWEKPMPPIRVHCDSQSTIPRHKVIYIMVNLVILEDDIKSLDN